jgi:hypothetical protein
MSCIKIGSKDIPLSKLSGYRLELSKFLNVFVGREDPVELNTSMRM